MAGSDNAAHTGNGARFDTQLRASSGFAELSGGVRRLNEKLLGDDGDENSGYIPAMNKKLERLEKNPAVRLGNILTIDGIKYIVAIVAIAGGLIQVAHTLKWL